MEFKFGNYLEELRGKMSLREAAKVTGLSHTYIRDLELGKKTDPSKDTLLKLANAYGVRYDDLLYRVYNTKLNSLEVVNDDARKYFKKEIEIVLDEMTVNDAFFDFLRIDINSLEEKYSDVLDTNGNITPNWLKEIVLNARYDSEWVYDLISDLKKISKKHNLNLELDTFLFKKGITYKGHIIHDHEKQLLTTYLDALFSNR